MTTAKAPRTLVKRALYRSLLEFGTQTQTAVSSGALWETPDSERLIEVGTDITGSSELANIKAGRQERNNDFTVRVVCWFFGDDRDQAEEEVEKLAHAVDSWLADHPKLIADGHPGVDGLRSVRVNAFDGPESVPADGGAGWQARCGLDLDCRMRLT